MVLPDGRAIGVGTFGDPAGPPAIYCHGWPACRLEAGLISDLGISLFALDRPGYGRSDPQPGRKLLDWPADVAAAADRLGLRTFHAVGASGGGPFAAALAAALPDRVRTLTLINAVPPADTPGLDGSGVSALFSLGRQPRRARWLLSAARLLLRMRLLTARRMVGTGLAEADRACLSPAMLDAIGRVWREALHPGTRGALDDAAILAAPWGFDLRTIRVPTAIWAGTADTVVPPAAASAYARIPGAVIHKMTGVGHYSLPLRHSERILAALVQDPC